MRPIVVTGVMLLCTACTIPAGRPPSPVVSVPAASGAAEAVAAVAQDVLAEVNRTRVANGRKAMRDDPALSRAAREHSEELAARRTLDHNSTDPSRRTVTMRIEAAGGIWNRAAENLAQVSAPASDVPARTVQLWLTSEGHRRNMLEPVYTHTGVGVAIDQYGVWYITQVYVLPRGFR
jgi:uncharacterized protein YkwD